MRTSRFILTATLIFGLLPLSSQAAGLWLFSWSGLSFIELMAQ